MTKKQGKLKYFQKDNSWNILLENNSILELNPNQKVLDIDIKLSDYYIPCAVDLEDGSLCFVKSFLKLDNFFEYEIIIYLPFRTKDPLDEFEIFEVPF